jgi:N-acetylglucosamine-6-phosphate deacetylase
LAPPGEAAVPDVPTVTGYVDLQVNGYAGVDFNRDALTASELHHACTRLEADGVAAFLPTIITDDVEVMCRRLAALARAREEDWLASRLIVGIHIEGPFLNDAPGFRGAHPQDAIRDADVEVMKRLLDAAAGLTRIVTLAPERDPGGRVIRMLAGDGIIVSGGHSDASIDELRAAIDAGLSMFTHVGNGCPMQMHRHDNIVQRVLSLAPELWLSFIADGAHVPFLALGNYLTLAGYDRAIIVTDAIAPAGLGPGRYTLGRWDVVVDSDMVPRSPDRSHFLGSAVTMQQSVDNLRRALNVPPDALRRLTSENPGRLIGL